MEHKMMYVAKDGKAFLTEVDCAKHEMRLDTEKAFEEGFTKISNIFGVPETKTIEELDETGQNCVRFILQLLLFGDSIGSILSSLPPLTHSASMLCNSNRFLKERNRLNALNAS